MSLDEPLGARAFNQPKFLVDTMCGRLSKWLRILGYDASWLQEKERSRLIVRCLKESRILVTRDHRFEKTRGIKKLILRSERIAGQLRQMVEELSLKIDREKLFSLCSFCNVRVASIDKEMVLSQVPPFVLETHSQFYCCPECKRIYWEGSHKELFEKQLTEIL